MTYQKGETGNPEGKPSSYTPELGDYICSQIASARSMISICEEEGMPTARTVYNWLRVYDEFRDNYLVARSDQADYLAEQTLEVADDPDIDPADKRVRVDTRKWLACKFKPKMYGERIQNDVNIRDYSQLSDDELDRLIQERQQQLEHARED